MSGRRFEEAGFKEMMRVWRSRARGKHRDCSAVGSAGIRGKHRGSRTGAVRGEILSAWAYVLRASLKTQSAPDFRNFVGFMPLARGRLGR